MIIDLSAATATSIGLKVYARLDSGEYEEGINADAELAAVNIVGDTFHPGLKYTIHPAQLPQ